MNSIAEGLMIDWKALTTGFSANEETNIFNRKSMWSEVDQLDEKYSEFLRPHSTPYFSRLRPLFSFEIKSLDSLNQFSHVLLRDGVLFLLKFFERFPEPKHLITKVLVHKDLGWVVPKAWQEQVFLYERVSDHDRSVIQNERKPKKNLLIVDLHDLESIEGTIEEKIELINGPEVEVLSFFNMMRGKDIDRYDRGKTLSFHEWLKNRFSSAKNISWSELSGSENYQFINCNEDGLFYRDSYVSHFLLQRGAKDLLEKKTLSGQMVSLSPYHSVIIADLTLNDQELVKHKLLYETYNYPCGELFQGEPQIDRGIEDYFKLNYYSTRFFKFCLYLNSLK